MSDLDLREEPYDGPTAQQLIDAVQLEYVVRYGAPDTTPVDPAEFARPAGRFVVGYIDTTAVAMGGVRRVDDATVEIKRMYVTPEFRGQGLSRVVLAHLEALARELGATRVLLETGPMQPEAIQLYETSGYEAVEGFGHYRDEPGAAAYGKTITDQL
ncbi:MAG TPA: GNAT family N-acetyltransferase [Mycobacteriales bacterium]|nr:GNAT family N-acetyltransferase [Mycobacteriales bacterium]